MCLGLLLGWAGIFPCVLIELIQSAKILSCVWVESLEMRNETFMIYDNIQMTAKPILKSNLK